MVGLRIHQSNRLEELARQIAEVCDQKLDAPLEPDRVVVPNPGMARWLSLQFADHLGIAANVEFPLPASFVWSLWRSALDDVPENPVLPRPVLAWRIFDILQSLDDPAALAPLRAHLADGDDRRRFELADQIAETFDQYLVYRPELILGWEGERHPGPSEDPDEEWQRELWRHLTGGRKLRHRARLTHEFDQISSAKLAQAPLPSRVHIFGIPTLAPVHLGSFRRLAEVREVHLFTINPCDDFWELIDSPSNIARRSGDSDPRDSYLESGNPLLASMGQQGRQFVIMQEDSEPYSQTKSFEMPGDGKQNPSILEIIQLDILKLKTRDDTGSGPSPARVSSDDHSIQVHVCHSPMREVEILHDRLLEMFANDPDLSPSQIRIMTPDIEAYAPLISAVFGTAEGTRRIPFAIADREPRSERPAIDAFLSLLKLPGSRFEATSLLALLETEVVRRGFEFEEDDLAHLARWIRQAGIRWGIDAEQRAHLGLPGTPENTWRFGMDRLMSGYAMAGHGERMLGEILPCDGVEGEEVRRVGQLYRFAEEVFEACKELEEPRPASAWRQILEKLTERFFTGPGTEDDVDAIRGSIRRLQEESHLGGFEGPLSLRLVAQILDGLLGQPQTAWAFLSGGVTFCTMVPMRNIPAQIVCLLGMSDDRYPRSRRPPGYDLIARTPRLGDRSHRDDDRYLFLEALLSARKTFYVSYVGRSIRDNSPLAPSILVSELADVVRNSCQQETPPHDKVELELTHPLQPFSQKYFDGQEALFSYAPEFGAAARAARAAHEGPDRTDARETFAFVPAPLAPPDDEWRNVNLDELLRFYRHPARYFLRERMGIRLDESEDLIEDSEPFEVGGLERYLVREHLFRLAEKLEDPKQLSTILAASGTIPHGEAGRELIDKLSTSIRRLRRNAGPLLSLEPTPPPPIDHAFPPMRLVGSLGTLTPEGIVEFGFNAPRGRDYLDLWIRHLALNLIEPGGVAIQSHRVSDAGILTLGAVTDPQEHLGNLLHLYWSGLQEPLPLFPEQSLECARDKRDDVELADIAKEWDPYPSLAFRGRSPGGEPFKNLARDVFAPLLSAVVRHE